MAKSAAATKAGTVPRTGRPSSYTDERAKRVLDKLVEGYTLKAACTKFTSLPPYTTVIRWADENPTFGAALSRARRTGSHAFVADTIAIADDVTEDPQSRRVRIGARQWYASKVNAADYGDKLEVKQDTTIRVVVYDPTQRPAIAPADTAVTIEPAPALEHKRVDK